MSDLTKKALAQSLKRLLDVKPLSKITISDVTEDCGVSRMTFYYHFHDIYDLIEWTCNQDFQKIQDGQKNYKTWQEGVMDIFKMLEVNHDFFYHVYHSPNHVDIDQFLFSKAYTIIYDIVQEIRPDASEDLRRFFANYHKYAITEIMLNWLATGMKEEPARLVEKMNLILQGSFERMVDNQEKSGLPDKA